MNLLEWELIRDGFKKTYSSIASTEYHKDCGSNRIKICLDSDFCMKSRTYFSFYRGGLYVNRDPREGPAQEYFYSNGNVKMIEYVVFGIFSRPIEDGPAIVHFDENGQATDCYQQHETKSVFLKAHV